MKYIFSVIWQGRQGDWSMFVSDHEWKARLVDTMCLILRKSYLFCCVVMVIVVSFNSNTTGVTCGAGTINPSEAPEFSPVFSKLRIVRSFCVMFVHLCLSFCPFSFCHCVAACLSIYGFWFPKTMELVWGASSLAKITALSSKNKYWLARNHDNVSEWSGMSARGLLL